MYPAIPNLYLISHILYLISKKNGDYHMIYYVSGNVAILEPGLAVIDCGGVGYG